MKSAVKQTRLKTNTPEETVCGRGKKLNKSEEEEDYDQPKRESIFLNQ